jgi:hypothetical protein
MTSATSCVGIKRVTFMPVFRSHTTLSSSSVDSTSDCDYSRKLIKYMVQMQDDFLQIPELSSKQKKALMHLRRRLIDLNLQTEAMRIKPALIELMNSLN